MLKTMGLQLIIYLIKHETNLTSTELDNVSIFQTAGKAKHKKKKKGAKMGAILELRK